MFDFLGGPFVPGSGEELLGAFTSFWEHRVFCGEPGAAGDLLPATLSPGLTFGEEAHDSSWRAPPPPPPPAAGTGLAMLWFFLAAGEAEERRLGRVLREGRPRCPPRWALMAGWGGSPDGPRQGVAPHAVVHLVAGTGAARPQHADTRLYRPPAADTLTRP